MLTNIYFQTYTPPDANYTPPDTNLTKSQVNNQRKKFYYQHLKACNLKAGTNVENLAPVRPTWAIPKKASTNTKKEEKPFAPKQFTPYIPPTSFAGKIVRDAIASSTRDLMEKDRKRDQQLNKARQQNEKFIKWAHKIQTNLKKSINNKKETQAEELYKEFKGKIELFTVDKKPQ